MANRFDPFAPKRPEAPAPGFTVTPRSTAPAPVPGANRFDPFAANPAVPRPMVPGVNFNKVFGELKPAERTPSEALGSAFQDALIKLGADPYKAGHMTRGWGNVVQGSPLGVPMSAVDAVYNAKRGNKVAAVLDAIGAVPGSIATSAGRELARAGTRTGLREGGQVPRSNLIPGDRPPPFIIEGRPENRPWNAGALQTWTTPGDAELRAAAQGAQGYLHGSVSPVRYHPDSIRDFIAYGRQNLATRAPNREVIPPEATPELNELFARYGQSFPGTPAPRPPQNLGFNPAVIRQPAPVPPREISPVDYDVLRNELRNLPGKSGIAGRRLANELDRWMVDPASRAIAGTPADIDQLRRSFDYARGNWRAAETAEPIQQAVHDATIKAAGEGSGFNLGNRARQKVGHYVSSETGRDKLFGARPGEIRAIEDAAYGDTGTNVLRAGSNLLGGGGGAQMYFGGGTAGGAAGTIAHYLGLDPYATLGLASGVTGATMAAGRGMRSAANTRTVNAAEEAAAGIRRNSPLFADNLAAAGGLATDPRSFYRAMIAMALTPTIKDSAQDAWAGVYAPSEDDQRNTVTPPTSR